MFYYLYWYKSFLNICYALLTYIVLLYNLFLADTFHYLDAPVLRVTGADLPMPYALNLERECVPDAQNVIKTVKLMMNLK